MSPRKSSETAALLHTIHIIMPPILWSEDTSISNHQEMAEYREQCWYLYLLPVGHSLNVAMIAETIADLNLTIQEPDEQQQQHDVEDGQFPQKEIASGEDLLLRWYWHCGIAVYIWCNIWWTSTSSDEDYEDDSGNGCQRRFHPWAQHREVAVVQQSRDDEQTVEPVTETLVVEHRAQEYRISCHRRQARHDDAEKVSWIPAG